MFPPSPDPPLLDPPSSCSLCPQRFARPILPPCGTRSHSALIRLRGLRCARPPPICPASHSSPYFCPPSFALPFCALSPFSITPFAIPPFVCPPFALPLLNLPAFDILPFTLLFSVPPSCGLQPFWQREWSSSVGTPYVPTTLPTVDPGVVLVLPALPLTPHRRADSAQIHQSRPDSGRGLHHLSGSGHENLSIVSLFSC